MNYCEILHAETGTDQKPGDVTGLEWLGVKAESLCFLGKEGENT